MFVLKAQATLLALVSAGLLVAGSAKAELVDFTDSSQFSNSDLVGNYSFGTVTVSASNGTPNFVPMTGTESAAMPAGTGLALNYDGVGVNDDELTLIPGNNEFLNVVFANPVQVNRLDFLDLFAVGSPANPGATGPETIMATFCASAAGLCTGSDLVAQMFFTGTAPNPPGSNGYFTETFNPVLAQRLIFNIPTNSLRDDLTADAAVAAIGVVPIPAAAWLFGSALLSVAGIGYRRNRAA